MSRRVPHLRRCLVALAFSAAVCGCRTPEKLKPPVEDVTPQRQARKSDVLKDFDVQRDKAQYAAALARWQTGDISGCRESLQALLKRSPQHVEGQQLLHQLDQMVAIVDEDSPGPPLSEAPAAPPTFKRQLLHQLDKHVHHEADATPGQLQREQRAAPSAVDQPVASVDKDHAALLFGPVDPELSPEAAAVVSLLDTPVPASLSKKAPAAGRTSAPATSAGEAAAVVSYLEPLRGPTAATRPLQADEVIDVPRDASSSHGGARGNVARNHLRQAARSLAGGDAEQAAIHYRDAMAAEPTNREIPVAGAVMALRRAQPELAEELAQSATSRFPNSASAFRTLGTVCYRRGDYRAAQSALQRAISLDKSHPLSYFLMGYTLRRLGENEAAGWNFQQARRLDPKYAPGR